ncbi:acyltransferase family protein [Chitinophaga pendula]|uniref:acyltransferase family protein n=1 Tax=Chitinophaga TaxID=79328 RepID=UPI000BAED5F0|nr:MULTISPECIES: acyltransferase family protein [Chitinophaga]ASZ14094.1 hypothetical protein CK934_25660 [Chitinophaga sp. MD30]UCJ08274.1 acyltransferase family protein [Chitinophaga pendula]
MLKDDKVAVPAVPVAGIDPAVAVAGQAVNPARLFYIDWVKAGCIAILIPYHAALLYSSFPYHMKSKETSIALSIFNAIVLIWYVAVLMFVAGYGARIAMIKRNPLQFITARLSRLVIPLLFGVFVIVPPQIYLEHLYKGEIDYNYFTWYTQHYFTNLTPYPAGNLSWHHLWYIGYLAVISALLLPLCVRIKKVSPFQRMPGLRTLLSSRYGNILLVVPILMIEFFLRIHIQSGVLDIIHDSLNFIVMCFYYIYGFMLASDSAIYNGFLKSRKICLSFALISVFIYYGGVLTGLIDTAHFDTLTVQWINAWRGMVAWCFTAAIIGYASRYLNINNKILRYASQAFLPVYIIHQTILFILAYYVLGSDINPFAGFLLLTVSTFIISMLVFEFGIRRFKITRLLFGIY